MSESDDEYGPVAATWGSQSTTTASTASWLTLVDPDAKTGPNGLGSGQLHRKGRNFVPISEQDILAHRMSHGSSKKKLGTKETPLPKKSTRKISNKPVKRPETPVQPSLTRPSSKNQEASPWNSLNLVETPFWENASNTINSSFSNKDIAAPQWQTTNSSPLNNTAAVKQSNTLKTGNKWAGGITNEPVKQNSWGNKNNELNQDAGRKSSNTNSDTDGWGSLANISENKSNGWGAEKSSNTAQWSKGENEPSDWGTSDAHKTQTIDWPSSQNTKSSVDLGGWGVQNKHENQLASDEWNSFSEIESTRPKTPVWLDPDQETEKANGKYQFSNPGKKKYSEFKPASITRPMNYSRDKEIPIPTQVAPAPPPENSVVVTIFVELNDTLKIPVKIRELDEPQQLAKEFAEENNVNTDSVIQALTKLFDTQKTAALKKKSQKLQRRAFQPSHNTKYYPKKSVHNNHTHNSSKDTFNAVTPQQVPFTRSQYY